MDTFAWGWAVFGLPVWLVIGNLVYSNTPLAFVALGLWIGPPLIAGLTLLLTRTAEDREPPTEPAAYRRRSRAVAVPESVLEERFLGLLRKNGFKDPVLQHWVRVDSPEGLANYRLDFAYVELRLGIETDGRAFHEGRESSDQARDRQLAALGWRILRFTWSDVVTNPQFVTSRLIEVGVPRLSTPSSAIASDGDLPLPF